MCLPLNLENGEIECEHSPENGQYPTDTVAFFTCNDGYMRTGPIFITCQDSGIWDPEIGTCDEGITVHNLFKQYKI